MVTLLWSHYITGITAQVLQSSGFISNFKVYSPIFETELTAFRDLRHYGPRNYRPRPYRPNGI